MQLKAKVILHFPGVEQTRVAQTPPARFWCTGTNSSLSGTATQRNVHCSGPEGNRVTRFSRGSIFNFKMRLHYSYLILKNLIGPAIRRSWRVHL